MSDIPVSDSITARPVWRRRQLRYCLELQPTAPSEREKRDAIRVLEDSSNEAYVPELYFEAFSIFEEASRD